jgi:hypothetical protein
LYYESGDEEFVDLNRRRKNRNPQSLELEEDAMEVEEGNTQVDILENLRDRTIKEHVSDEAVGKEIERR